ncbi:MAG: hypothetical protein WC476_01760 [Phycisphaerae bacterium]
MRITKLRGMLSAERKGAALLIMLLLIVVFCGIIWFDPMALISGKSKGMPWGEERRLVRPGQEVKQPKEGQPKIVDNLVFKCPIVEDKEVKGGVVMYFLPDGKIKGAWGGTYKPDPDLLWEVTGSRFKGNIDPTKIYKDEAGEDPNKLYFITKGNFLILETNSKTDKVRTATGSIYVTGWLDNKYNAVGKVTITSDKEKYWEYYWQAKGEKAVMVPDFGPSLPGLF